MPSPIELTDEDVAYLLMILRNSPQPKTTQELIELMRNRAVAKEEHPALE